MINKHGVDLSRIQVGDVVAMWDSFIEITSSGELKGITAFWDEAEFLEDDDIEWHYARQPREERG